MKKHIITILAALICAASFAQTTSKDTAFVSRGAGVNRYVTNRITRADGNVRVYQSGVLDTTNAQSYIMAMYDGKLNNMVLAAQEAFSLDAVVKPFLLGETTSKDTLGTFRSPQSALEEKYKSGWVFSDWSFNPGTPVTAPIAEDGATGNLEITISGTDYRVLIGPDWIVIKDYPTASSYTALFRLRPGVSQFRNFGQTITLSR